MNFSSYKTQGFYDELFSTDGCPREIARSLISAFEKLPRGELKKRQEFADQNFLNTGVTFTMNGDKSGFDRIFPFDLIPRLIDSEEWLRLEAGLKQRIARSFLFCRIFIMISALSKKK